jgi:hypothetical protein
MEVLGIMNGKGVMKDEIILLSGTRGHGAG